MKPTNVIPFQSKYIPPMMEALFREMPERFVSPVMVDDDMPPPLPEDAIRAAFSPSFREELNTMEDEREVRLNRMREAIHSSNRPRRYSGRPYRRSNTPKLMAARYAGTCHETKAEFSAGDSILWVPSERACYVVDSETYQDFLLSQREEN